jgi:hypothetical protein
MLPPEVHEIVPATCQAQELIDMKLRIPTFLVLVFASAAACAQADRLQLGTVSVDKLKTAYLNCASRSEREVLDPGTARTCSLAAEELLQRGFAGNFEQLLAWWRSARERSERAVTEPPAPPREAALPAV